MWNVLRAEEQHIEGIIQLDESVVGSRSREVVIRKAVADGQCLIVADKGQITGFGIIHNHFYGNDFIELLIVGEAFRRQGLGSLLLEAFKKAEGTEKLFTSTNSSNLPMQGLLESSGFVQCGWINELDEGDPELVYCFRRKDRDQGVGTHLSE